MTTNQPYKKKPNTYDYYSGNGLQKNKRPQQDASFQHLIEVAAEHLGLGDQLYAIRICTEARKLLQSYFPNHTTTPSQDATAQPSIKVNSYKNHTLHLSAASSALIHQLTMRKHLLQTELNAKFGQNTIVKITIKTRS